MTRLVRSIGTWALVSVLGSAHATEPEPAATHRLTIRARTADGELAAHASLRVDAISALSGPERSLERKISERLRNSSWLAADADVPDALDAHGEATLDVRGSWILRVGVATPTESECVKVEVGPGADDLLELDLRRDAIVALHFDERFGSLTSCAFRLGDDPVDREMVADGDGWIRFRGLAPGTIVRPMLPRSVALHRDRDTSIGVNPPEILAGELGTETRVDAAIVEEPLTTLRGTVVDEAGRGLASSIEWIVTDGDRVDVVREVRSDEGAFSIDVIPRAMLRVRAALHAEAIVFSEPQSSTVGVVRLTRFDLEDMRARGRVRGVVRRDDDGQPIAGVTARSTQIATGDVREYARTDARGRFDLDPIPAGDLVLEVDTGDAMASKRIHLGDGDTVEVDLRVARCEYVEIRAIDEATRRSIEQVVAVVDGRATPRTAFALSRITPTPFEFHAPGYEPLTRSLSAADATHHRIVVELRRRSP
ncbi:MAG: carboxypeptidase regulatory-like domain-containing protein [Planctomycetes bacterium]|nr:carboxypeptidase regulatory-like domain-containing protein [Planctomycetota bacterium]MCC7169466.1 carboxypeptidase regulatory-like domain-containing protein [Planctomycetota bacterium]